MSKRRIKVMFRRITQKDKERILRLRHRFTIPTLASYLKAPLTQGEKEEVIKLIIKEGERYGE